jgi:hypothetical protein
MENFYEHPFLLSLRRTVGQTDDLAGYETSLQAQQDEFREYLKKCCPSEIPAQKRYEFLQNVDYEVCHIRLLCADKIRANHLHFYHFWSTLIVDTRRYIKLGLKVLEFQRKLPPHMLAEASQTFANFKWTSSRIDLSEVIAGLFQVDTIRLKDGSRPSFALFAKCIGELFGVPYDNPHDDLRKVMSRKKNPTPFLFRIIESIRDKM